MKEVDIEIIGAVESQVYNSIYNEIGVGAYLPILRGIGVQHDTFWDTQSAIIPTI